MPGFEPWTSDCGSANWATTTAQNNILYLKSQFGTSDSKQTDTITIDENYFQRFLSVLLFINFAFFRRR